MDHQRLLWNMHCVATVVLRKQLNFKSAVIRSNRSSCLEYGRHVGQLRRRRCAYAPTSNTASHDNHEKINSRVSFSFLYEYGAPLGGPSGRRSSAINTLVRLKNFGYVHMCMVTHILLLRNISVRLPR